MMTKSVDDMIAMNRYLIQKYTNLGMMEEVRHLKQMGSQIMNLECKDWGGGTFQLWAPPMMWGPKMGGVKIHSSVNKDAVYEVSYDTRSNVASTFDIEIWGEMGARIIKSYGPGASELHLPASRVSKVYARAKSHTFGQNILVRVIRMS